MKRLTTVLFSFVFLALMNAQDYKIIYNFKWKTTPTDANYHSELTALSTNGRESYFEALSKLKYDSLKTDLRNKGIRGVPSPMEGWKLQNLVVKDLISQTTASEQEIFDKTYITKYTCKPTWKILPEKSKIFGYDAQKAETDFGGRRWTAWFTMAISIHDGPYKFFGLPGLILKMNDAEDNFSFEIKGLTKEKLDISQRNRPSSVVSLSPAQWKTFWTKYQKEPANIFANLNEAGATYSYVYNGKDVNAKETKDTYNKAEWEKMAIFRNPIELNYCE